MSRDGRQEVKKRASPHLPALSTFLYRTRQRTPKEDDEDPLLV